VKFGKNRKRRKKKRKIFDMIYKLTTTKIDIATIKKEKLIKMNELEIHNIKKFRNIEKENY
jgi:hypothetical protein